MNSCEKDELIRRIIALHVPGRNMSLSDIISVDDRVRMGEAIEVILELKQRGFVEQYQRVAEDLRFGINGGLQTFAERGGFSK